MSYCIVVKEVDNANTACVITLPNGSNSVTDEVRETLTNALVEHYDSGVKVPFNQLRDALTRAYSKGFGELKVFVDTDYEGESYNATLEIEFCGLF